MSQKLYQALREVDTRATGFLLYNQNLGNRDIVRHINPAILKTKGHLEKLNLSHNRISDKGFEELFQVLSDHAPRLQYLNIGGNYMEQDGMDALCKYIMTPSLSMSTLFLNDMDCTETMDAFVDAMAHNTSITGLHLVHSRITGDQTARLLQFNRLSSLHICGNDIGSEGATKIAEVLSHPNQLHFLCMVETDIGERGMAEMVFMLSKNTSLKQLRLPDDHVGIEVWHSLSRSLQTNTTLLHLDITSVVDQEGFDIILDAVAHNTTLQGLDMICDDFTITHIDSRSLHHFETPGAYQSDEVIQTILDNKTRLETAQRQKRSFLAGIESPFVSDMITRMMRILKN